MRLTRQFDLVLKVGIVVLTVLTITMIYLYTRVDTVLQSTRQEMVDMIVDRYRSQLQNIAKMLQEGSQGSLIETLSRYPTIRHNIERQLFFHKTKEIDNLFVIYRDEKGRYRYLLDAEQDPIQKAMFRQRFEPISDIWERTYRNRKSSIEYHKKFGKLWVTLTVPVVEKGNIVAIVGSDLSTSIRTDVQKSFYHIKLIMLGVVVAIAMLLFFGYLQIYYYFKGRNKSFYDPLTGAYNRKFLYEVLASDSLKKYQIIMLDVDNFKKVNDTYGHEVGDKVLQLLCTRLNKQLREKDLLVRYGGEEFIVFLRTANSTEGMEVAKRLKYTVEISPFVIDENILSLTISLGMNTDVEQSPNLDEAIAKADEQLYFAKNAGRNRIYVNSKVVF